MRPSPAPLPLPVLRPGPGTALLLQAGVVLVLVERDHVVLAPFARNLERAARVLREARASLLIAHGSEWLDTEPTARLLRERGRTAWSLAEVILHVDLEPLPGVDYGVLLLDAEPSDDDPDGPPWACDEDRDEIAEARAAGWSQRRGPATRRLRVPSLAAAAARATAPARGPLRRRRP